VPQCYLNSPSRLQPGYFAKFQQDTLFYVFYSMPGDEAQLYAADELANRGWWFHKARSCYGERPQHRRFPFSALSLNPKPIWSICCSLLFKAWVSSLILICFTLCAPLLPASVAVIVRMAGRTSC